MFIKNDHLQDPRRHLDFFVPSRPYKGEPPTVAGFLLYPDAPAKMETTSREAFCFKQLSKRDRGKGDHVNPNTRQEFHLSHPTSSRPAGRGSGSKDREPGEDEREGNDDRTKEQDPEEEMKSQYQKDFPPPSCCRRRRTPAPPQADNIGINPAFRIDFSTVQRETFSGWPAVNPSCAARPRAASSRQSNMNK